MSLISFLNKDINDIPDVGKNTGYSLSERHIFEDFMKVSM